ncbi:S-layer homology domain-containing protein [Butyricicoccus sp. AF22-28AC]|nr:MULTISPECIES: S-layer homology domain-containing protein [unclassified Butyricicoccus]RGM78217.1 S-layer homology domain-containing protein [Butyricicoccus sp. OM06-6AC]RHQ82759.1 S-layer homology domain-containing protein [Butyricicoccus sp. AF22-28AC]
MMKKRMTAGALAALMAAALPISACAAQNSAPQPQLNTAEHMQYMNGYTDGTFRPDASITRAEASKLLASLLVNKVKNEDHLFNDVSVSAWYADAVRQMTGFGLVNGYTDGTFKPNAKITRAEFVAILSRFPHTDIGTDKSFADVPKTNWAYNAVQTALAQAGFRQARISVRMRRLPVRRR